MKLILSDKYLNLDVSDHSNTKFIDLSSLNIANCTGCFGCWTKTPGKCVIRDDATKVYPYIAKSDNLIYISKILYGGYDTPMKTMLERAIISFLMKNKSNIIISFISKLHIINTLKKKRYLKLWLKEMLKT